jgi:hypothetical protein
MIFLGILGEGSIYAMVTSNPQNVRLRKMAGKRERGENANPPSQKSKTKNRKPGRGELGFGIGDWGNPKKEMNNWEKGLDTTQHENATTQWHL